MPICGNEEKRKLNGRPQNSVFRTVLKYPCLLLSGHRAQKAAQKSLSLGNQEKDKYGITSTDDAGIYGRRQET